MEAKTSKTKTPAELNKKIQELKAELFTLRFQNATGQLEHTHKIKKIKREIAQIFTILAKQKTQKSFDKTTNNDHKKNQQVNSTTSKHDQERQKGDKS